MNGGTDAHRSEPGRHLELRCFLPFLVAGSGKQTTLYFDRQGRLKGIAFDCV
jgi:hypothetical protein